MHTCIASLNLKELSNDFQTGASFDPPVQITPSHRPGRVLDSELNFVSLESSLNFTEDAYIYFLNLR